MRILIDMDNVIYDIDTPWIKIHNDEYPDHTLTVEEYIEWDRRVACSRVDCPADIYKYLNNKRVWTDGPIIEGSREVIARWIQQNHELGVITAVGNSIAANRKISWLNTHLPDMKNIIITYGRNKHWISGDVLIDDGIHNLEHFTGISILYNQPWNRSDVRYPRARDWKHVEKIVSRADLLLRSYMHKFVERVLYQEIEEGIL